MSARLSRSVKGVPCETVKAPPKSFGSILGAGVMLFVLLTLPALGADRTFLPGLVPPVVAHLIPLGRLPATNHLELAIGLPLRNHAALTALLQQMYDPASTNFHRYLTPKEFTAKYGPTEADYQKVLQFVRANGLAVVGRYDNRQLVNVSASVADIDKTFKITLYNYQHPTEHRVFYAPDTEPSVEAGVPILSVSGLNNYELPHPASEMKSR